MRTTSFVLASTIALLTSSAAFAQMSSSRLAPRVEVSRRVAPPEAAHRHSSTAYEGARRGEAAWIAAYGDYLVDEGQAAYIWEHVESMHYDNTIKKTVTALTRKRILADYREQERQLRRDRQEAAKQLWHEKYLDLAHSYRLDEFQFNWATGAIYWPATAASPRYATHRQRLARLMGQVVRYDAASSRIYRTQIVKACTAFRDQLLEDAAVDHPSTRNEYLAMQRFLLGIKYAPYLMTEGSTRMHLAGN